MRYRWASPLLLLNLLVEFAGIVMMRKCLLGIKRPAEVAAREREARPSAPLEA